MYLTEVFQIDVQREEADDHWLQSDRDRNADGLTRPTGDFGAGTIE